MKKFQHFFKSNLSCFPNAHELYPRLNPKPVFLTSSKILIDIMLEDDLLRNAHRSMTVWHLIHILDSHIEFRSVIYFGDFSNYQTVASIIQLKPESELVFFLQNPENTSNIKFDQITRLNRNTSIFIRTYSCDT